MEQIWNQGELGGETAAAIATPMGVSGVGMVRLSGPQSLEIAAGLVRARRDPRRLPGYSGLYGRAWDEGGDIDEVVVFVYRAPHSSTGEDAAEICCHGGPYLLRRVLARCVALGAVPAGPGEFTRRAFVHGKLTLTQAEAVASLCAAEGRQGAGAALAARDGAVFREITSLRQELVSLSAALTAWVDYPEEEQESVLAGQLRERMDGAARRLERLERDAERVAMCQDGVSAAIVGRPNVGKSTLMNLLTGEETSIVTDVAGTTRDVVEGRINLGEVTLRLWDTAGIRRAGDAIEAAGVARAKSRLERAQLVLVVLDGSGPLSGDDREILEAARDKPSVAVVNKADLGAQVALEEVAPFVRETVRLSARTGQGSELLEQAVRRVLELDQLDPNAAILCGERQRACAREARERLTDALEALDGGITLDAVHVLLDGAVDALLSLTGERATQAVVDEVFARFCVGK